MKLDAGADKSIHAALPPALRREQLLMRSTALRLQLARDAQVLQAPLAIADRVRDGVLWLRRHPEWPAGALLLVVVLRPRRAWRWAGRALWIWRLWRRSRVLLAGALPKDLPACLRASS